MSENLPDATTPKECVVPQASVLIVGAGLAGLGGEHTGITWQGYMNGAVESGLRAAEEMFASAKFADYFCSENR